MTRMTPTFEGCFVALVTPFRDGHVDEQKLRALVDWHVERGTSGIVSCGTTGESPTLSHEEHHRVIDVTIEAAAGRIPVIAGTGSNSTAEAVSLTRHAETAGAAGVLVVCPYYNRPTQAGLTNHFATIARSTTLPLIIYNIQSRTAVNLETATLAQLAAAHTNIAGVKEASGSLDQMSQVVLACPPEFTMLSGDDSLTLPCIAVGGRGVISTIANIVPREMAQLVRAALDGDMKDAREQHQALFPLMRAAFMETNPIPIKEAMAMAGMIEPELRLPMCRMGDANRERLREVLRQCGVLKGAA
jgi:4-hydroxy-tetrahydrodipicolinate synthase